MHLDLTIRSRQLKQGAHGMRKITRDAVLALRNGYHFGRDNTRVDYNIKKDRWEMLLHNNLIAYRTCEVYEIYIRDAGWRTSTTKERLNGILKGRGTIFQKDFEWYIDLNGGTKPFPYNEWVEI